ncbi:MAG: methyltransferase domain-containing protein [Saprospiraceae bacterium]|nr:methyltransferase domain-containing protein [Saprospiraceae bacterium]
MNYILLFCLGIFIVSCGNQSGTKEVETIKESTTNEKSIRDTLNDDKTDFHERTIWQKPYEIINLLGPLENKTVADIGAGSGYFSFKFIHVAQKVIAIDIEKELVELMKDELNYYKPELRSKFEARLAKTNDPMLNNNEVDVIFLSNTYCYISNRVQYLKNLKSKLKEHGKIMIVDFKKKITPIGPDLKARLAQGDVETDLIDAGFEIVLSDDTKLQYQYIIIAEVKK